MNPFNQKRFRGEHEIGDAYMAIRAVYENIDAVVTAANNIHALRSGNIELKTEGLLLLWKYAAEEEWKVLGDLSPFINQYIQSVVDVNNRMDAMEITVDSTVVKTQSLVNSVDSLTTQLNTLSQGLNNLTNTVSTLSQELDTANQNISNLTARVEALETAPDPVPEP